MTIGFGGAGESAAGWGLIPAFACIAIAARSIVDAAGGAGGVSAAGRNGATDDGRGACAVVVGGVVAGCVVVGAGRAARGRRGNSGGKSRWSGAHG
ncbi:hypothetical protein [Rhodopseudomonas pseudopalustris]|uniref:hypothetical protein n=1 Tax=Rhodopseudomonas pseudopalustris TaxID=1513892 RepID=UPI000B8997F0|nr:hypothetical protein [Rhodopseudomonas pseudopalustris]